MVAWLCIGLTGLWGQQKLRSVGTSSTATTSVKVSGKVTGLDSEAPLRNARIHVDGSDWGIPTDSTGTFHIFIAPGNHTFTVIKNGYRTESEKVNILGAGELDFKLKKWALTLSEVVVQAEKADNRVAGTKPGLTSLSIKGLRVLPAFLGEVDVLRSIQLLPGVSAVGEGSAGFNVRGGQTDQNLILYDGMQLFNPTHALGFFSAFHPAASEKFDLYKGHVPAEYGGRASAVLTVETKKPDLEKRKTALAISPFMGNAMVEGPIVKDRTSFLLAGRVSWANWMLKSIQRLEDVRNSRASFWDLTGKLYHAFSPNSQLSLSLYGSGDELQFSDQYGYAWGSRLASLSWQRIAGTDWLFKTTVGSGQYRAELFEPTGLEAFRVSNGLNYHQAQQLVRFAGIANHKLQAGAEWIRYRGQDERLEPYEEGGLVAPLVLPKDKGNELSLYIQDDWTLSEKFGLSLGLRYGYFIKDADEHFQGLEPRMALRYKLNKTASFKASFDYRRQYIHQISNTTAPTPVDIWQVSTDFLPPQSAQNYSFGFFQNINKNRWETSLELFYKDMQNLSTYKDFAQLLANPNLGDALVSGIGRAWGAEARIGLRRGRWTGWLSYTFSRSLLQVRNEDPEASINQGAWFPANFDMPHALSLVANAKLGKTSTFSLTGTYRSGRPFTALVASYEVGTVSVPHYSDRNAYRIPDYVRLDASLTIGSFINTVDDKLVFSVYNVLARKNAFSVFYTRPERVLIPKPFKLSVLGAAFPSVSYRIEF